MKRTAMTYILSPGRLHKNTLLLISIIAEIKM